MTAQYRLPVESVTSDEEWQAVLKLYSGLSGVVKVGEDGWVLPCAYETFKDYYDNFELRNSDVFIMGFMKTGTTWVQDIAWTMLKNPMYKPMKGSANIRIPTYEADCFAHSSKSSMEFYARFIKMGTLIRLANGTTLKRAASHIKKYRGNVGDGTKMPSISHTKYGDVDISKAMLSVKPKEFMHSKYPLQLQFTGYQKYQRIYKTHLPFSVHRPGFIDKVKVVYVMRSPKDTLVSMYHFVRKTRLFLFNGTFDQFFRLFIEDKTLFSPFYKHMEEAWLLRDHPNMHIVFYEQLKADVDGEMRRLANFLGQQFTDIQYKKFAELTSFEAMKKRESNDTAMKVTTDASNFCRKGQIGDYKSCMTDEQAETINIWVKEKFGHLNLPFTYYT